MARGEKERWYFATKRQAIEDYTTPHNIAGPLDMVRYDDVRVQGNAPEGYWLFSTPHKPTVERWVSFGIRFLTPAFPSTVGTPCPRCGYRTENYTPGLGAQTAMQTCTNWHRTHLPGFWPACSAARSNRN